MASSMKITKKDFISLAREGKLEEIEAIFDSDDDYTRDEKVSLIEAENVFNTLIFSRHIVMPIDLKMKAMRLLGERLSRESCIQALHDYVSGKGQEHQQHAKQILEVFFDELRDTKFNIVTYTVFCKVLMNPSLHSTLCTLLESGCVDKEMLLIRSNDMPILELALFLQAKCDMVKLLISVGGQQLIKSSTVSLLQGAILLYGEETDILKLLLEVGGKDILKKKDLCEGILYGRGGYKIKPLSKLSLSGIAKIFNLLLDALLLVGETKILFKRCRKLKVANKKDSRQDGHSVLFDFAYYEHKEFVPIVKRIVDIGGLELLSMTNVKDASGKTVLHWLPSQPNVHVDMYDVLANCRNAVMLLDQNKKTPLHAACENSRLCCVDVFLKHGGRDVTWKRDSQGNTPLHLLHVGCMSNYEIFEKIVMVGGPALTYFKNKANREPFEPFFREAMFFQISKLKKSIETTNGANDEAMTELKIKNEVMKREIHELKIQVAREKNLVKDAVKFQFYRVEEQVIAKMNKEFKVEKESFRHQISSEKSQGQLEIETIKSMYNESLEVIKRTKDKIMRLEGLLESQKKDIDDYKALREKKLAAHLKATSSRVTYQVEESQAKKKELEQQLEKELECIICFDPFEDPHIVPECCHRFCLKRIDTAIKKSGKECPMCRKRISSKRSLRRDELIGKISKLVFSDDKGGGKNQVQQQEEGEKSMKNGIANQEETLKQNASNISQLEKHIAEKDEVITAKEQENDALKQEIYTLKLQLSNSPDKRSRDKNEPSDNDDDYIIPKKRSKPNETVGSRYCTNEEAAATLESENEDLLQQLKKEKANHMKTIERLENARKKLKESYLYQR